MITCKLTVIYSRVTHHSRLMTSPTQKSPSMSVDMVTPAYVGSSPRSSQMLETICVGTRTCRTGPIGQDTITDCGPQCRSGHGST